MNYLILKNIIETTLANFKCKECWSSVSEWNLILLWIAWNSINLEVTCPNCKTQWIIKAEIWFAQTMQSWEFLENIKTQLIWLKGTSDNIPLEKGIDDSDILSIRESLKNAWTIEDLFNM